MGNAPSYAKFATLQWYNEGTKLYGKAGFAQHAATFNKDDLLQPGCLAERHIAITGANTGIGFAIAHEAARLGANVHLLCRSEDKAKQAVEQIAKDMSSSSCSSPPPKLQYHILDVSDFDAVRAFARDWNDKPLHTLVNNAGLMPPKITRDKHGHEAITACTLGGTVLLTGLLLPAMQKTAAAAASGSSTVNSAPPPQVINVSSGGQYSVCARVDDLNFNDVADSSYDGTLWYAVNKKHQVMLTEYMASKFASSGVVFSSQHPGWCATDAVKNSMPDFYAKHKDELRTAAEGADTIVWLCAKKKWAAGENGRFWFDREAVRTDMPWSGTSASDEDRQRLFDNAVRYVGGSIPAFSSSG